MRPAACFPSYSLLPGTPGSRRVSRRTAEVALRERVADSALRAGSLAACGEGAITRAKQGRGAPSLITRQAKRAEAKPGTAKDRNSRTPRACKARGQAGVQRLEGCALTPRCARCWPSANAWPVKLASRRLTARPGSASPLRSRAHHRLRCVVGYTSGSCDGCCSIGNLDENQPDRRRRSACELCDPENEETEVDGSCFSFGPAYPQGTADTER